MKHFAKPAGGVKTDVEPIYDLLDFFQFRAPLLPTEFYFSLKARLPSEKQATMGLDPDESLEIPGETHGFPEWLTKAIGNPLAATALAVGSLDLSDAIQRGGKSGAARERIQSRVLRYLIRMSTRPTPFGLFAGVAMGSWSDTTDLRIAEEVQTRTRPDMAWLLRLVGELESRPEVRRQLSVFANPATFVRSGRVFLAEKASLQDNRIERSVSIRYTRVVRYILEATRSPVPWDVLATRILSDAPAATPDMVEKLLTDLWEQSLLLTDLRPPLTSRDPARYVLDHLQRMPDVIEARETLHATLTMMKDWDDTPYKTQGSYRRMISSMAKVAGGASRSSIQVDSAVTLCGNHLARSVGQEVARAAEVLMRLSPWPAGPTYLEEYRRAFQARYGEREILLLELLDPGVGLGPPPAYWNPRYQPTIRPAHNPSASGSQVLLDLAFQAMRTCQLVVRLDEHVITLLETSSRGSETVPASLDIYASIVATSAEAIDRGEFKISLGPNLGVAAAGRNLGRFADLLGADAEQALNRAARAEETMRPDEIWAELIYLPRNFRSANVVIRPPVRHFEVTWGASASVKPGNTIPINELVIGVEDGRFYLRWPRSDKNVTICVGHMLNYTRAPIVCRFLADLNRDRVAQLSAFSWGAASNFPCLPRVEYGRVVLRPAQWKLHSACLEKDFLTNEGKYFLQALDQWRSLWNVPRFVYLSEHDNRLLLDLDNPVHVQELYRNARAVHKGGRLVLEEVYPTVQDAWIPGKSGHYMAEIVVSLIRRPTYSQLATGVTKTAVESSRVHEKSPEIEERKVLPLAPQPDGVMQRLRPPGSEWLFLKLYCNARTTEDLIAVSLRNFSKNVTDLGLCTGWFFLRYSDPDPHVRVRFTGEAVRLTRELLPNLCAWAADLMTQGICLRFSFDTYEREVDRYGGEEGIAVAESVFHTDSWAAAELIHLGKADLFKMDRTTLAVLSLDSLFDGLGLSTEDRLQWCKRQNISRKEASADFHRTKVHLRGCLGSPTQLLAEPGGEHLAEILARFRERLRPFGQTLQKHYENHLLNRPPETLYASFVHMHLNRLGVSGPTERNIIALLWRVHQSLLKSPLRV